MTYLLLYIYIYKNHSGWLALPVNRHSLIADILEMSDL